MQYDASKKSISAFMVFSALTGLFLHAKTVLKTVRYLERLIARGQSILSERVAVIGPTLKLFTSVNTSASIYRV
jgi:hypothetical protein